MVDGICQPQNENNLKNTAFCFPMVNQPGIQNKLTIVRSVRHAWRRTTAYLFRIFNINQRTFVLEKAPSCADYKTTSSVLVWNLKSKVIWNKLMTDHGTWLRCAWRSTTKNKFVFNDFLNDRLLLWNRRLEKKTCCYKWNNQNYSMKSKFPTGKCVS